MNCRSSHRLCTLHVAVLVLTCLPWLGGAVQWPRARQWPSAIAAQSAVDACFASFLDSSGEAVDAYVASYEGCFQQPHKSRRLSTLEQRTARDDVERSANTVRHTLAYCNALESEIEFFKCHSAVGPTNMQAMFAIKYTSAVAVVDLEEQLEMAQKEVLVCSIEAQRKYTEDMSEAYQALSACLKGG